MFAAGKTAGASTQGPPDPQFNYVTMLLHGDGTNGAQNNTFLDSSTNNFTITRNGNTTQGSFSPYGSNWSNSFIRSASSYITISDSSAFSLGTSDFTIECWIFPTLSGSTQDISGQADSSITTTSRSFLFQINGAGNIIAGVWSGSTGYTITSSSAVSFNTWNHIAFVRSSGTLTLYINGVSVGTSSISTASVNDSSNNLSIGRFGERNTAYYDGYVSNFRMVVGTAIYTGSFTPSTTPLTAISGTALLTCADNRFIDDSTNNFAITANGTPSVQRFNPFGTSTAYSTSVIGGSGIFASGNWLDVSANSAFSFTGSFTVECWVYQTERGLNGVVTEVGLYTDGVMIRLGTIGGIYDAVYVNNNNIGGISTYVLLNSWNHIAVVRSGTSVTVYVNGVSRATGTVSGTVNGAIGGTRIGAPIHTTGSAQPFNGYITDFRIVKGTAVYTTTFTPPTTPLTAITNTSLLTNMTNGAIFDNAMMNDLETVGNAQISTSVVKYGTGSLAFDGAGDYLVAPSNAIFNMGTGNFTIECWAYPQTQLESFPALFNLTGVNDLSVAYNHGEGTANSFSMLTGGTRTSASVTSSVNAWYHIAIVRSGTTVTLYIDGTSRATTTNSSTLGGNTCTIGVYGTSFGTTAFKGYLDELRITKGYARYTANFTPPTAAFPNIGPT